MELVFMIIYVNKIREIKFFIILNKEICNIIFL